MPEGIHGLFLIAELGSVHDGSFGNALQLIEAAADCGADAVKFQLHIASAETRRDAPSPAYFNTESRFDYFNRTSFSREQWKGIADKCRQCGVQFLCSPFSTEAVELLDALPLDAFKIPSGEVTNTPLLERVAATRRPVLLSSGMSSWSELDRAVDILKASPLGVFQCSSIYPCPPEMVGLNVIAEIRARYGIPVGLSDHTLGPAAALAAVALGAEFIEKHFAFSRLMYGSDARHSMEPQEFRAMAAAMKEIRIMRQSLVDKDDVTSYADMKRVFEKSVVARRALSSGSVLKMEDLAFKKPGDGLSAARYRELLGRTLGRDLQPDDRIRPEDCR